ncbi:MAG: hypothetical protein KDE53_37010 [Caldilineaceae bacterium]|nr:hypothetical protein [Caldilineaceae bacterium]MCB0124940.1 hypothetical protein [Caldilineaceae bacterium]
MYRTPASLTRCRRWPHPCRLHLRPLHHDRRHSYFLHRNARHDLSPRS